MFLFLPKQDKNQGKDLVNKVTYLLLGLGLIFSAFLWIGAPLISTFFGNEQMITGLRKFAVIPILLLPTLGLDGIFASYQQTHLLAIYNTLNRVLMLFCLVVPVLWFENTTAMAINGWIAASILNFGLALWFRNLPFKGIKPTTSEITTKVIFTYSLPIVTANLWGMAIKYADQFYISNYFGPEVYAEFSNGFIEIPFIGMITSSASVVLMPLFSNYIYNNDSTKLVETLQNTIKKSALIIYPITVFCLIFSKEIIETLFSKSYSISGIYFKINILINFFNIIIFTPIILALGKTKFYSNMHMVFALWAWVSGVIIVNIFNSPYAIAVLSTANTIAIYLVAFFYASNLLKISVFKLVPLKLILIILTTCLVSLIIIKLIVGYYFISNNFKLLFISGILYFLVIIFIERIFNVPFTEVVKPILIKFKQNNS
ncbi:MAG: oligosaccharide flippase family protein [Saprospiraceae bacterium]|nr:oligosaccharide flippase family protein [Saprospiraceae bacterium]